MKKYFGAILFVTYLGLLIFTRFYNLENTARFGEDEAGFMVRAHQIYKERKITLVGQINQFGTKVFSSLTVYLLLPAAVIGNFAPISIFYGAAIYGVVTVLVLLNLISRFNKPQLLPAALLLLVFFPLVQSGRWAWNPNFIPLWISLGIIFSLSKNSWAAIFSGICFGLAVHQHYYAFFAGAVYLTIISIKGLVNKNILKSIWLFLGFGMALSPFIIFDLRHPPGIFLLGAADQTQRMAGGALLNNFWGYIYETAIYYTQIPILAGVWLMTIVLLLIRDMTNKSKALLFFIPVVSQIIFISTINVYFPHYFFANIPFLLVWLFYPRLGIGKFISGVAIWCLIAGGIFSLRSQLFVSPVQPDIKAFKQIDRILKEQIGKNKPSGMNIAVLASPDHNTHAEKFRYMLLVPDNISVMSHDEYFSNDLLFVISTSNEAELRVDPALEMNNFREGLLKGSWQTDSGTWRVFLFGRNR